MPGYSDYLLALIPVALISVTAAAVLTGASLEVAASIGGGASALLVGHALFVRGPVGATPPDASADSGRPSTAD